MMFDDLLKLHLLVYHFCGLLGLSFCVHQPLKSSLLSGLSATCNIKGRRLSQRELIWFLFVFLRKMFLMLGWCSSKNKEEFSANPDVSKASAYLEKHSKGETVAQLFGQCTLMRAVSFESRFFFTLKDFSGLSWWPNRRTIQEGQFNLEIKLLACPEAPSGGS